jgi:multicomponent Na+:H+ antiporter subunit E
MDSSKNDFPWSNVLTRGGLFLFIWWILAEGAARSWLIGIPAVMLALTASIMLVPPMHFRWMEFVKFLPFFFFNSLLGGVDVARRAFHPRLPIDPDLIHYHSHLPPGLPQVFMTLIVNLLPGTLGAELEEGLMKVHVLDKNKDYHEELRAIEQSVTRMFSKRGAT